MPSLIQKHAHVKGQRSNHHIFKFQPNPSWAKIRPNRYTSFVVSQNKPLLVFRSLTSRMGFLSDGHYATLQHADQPITHGINDNNVKLPKIVIMKMEFHNHKLQTKPRLRYVS